MPIYSINFTAGGANRVELNKANLTSVFGGSIPENINSAKLKLSIAASATDEYTVEGSTLDLYIHECKDIIDHAGLTTAGYQELVDTDSVDNSVVYFVKD